MSGEADDGGQALRAVVGQVKALRGQIIAVLAQVDATLVMLGVELTAPSTRPPERKRFQQHRRDPPASGAPEAYDAHGEGEEAADPAELDSAIDRARVHPHGP
jgi:hypothetical protein